MKLFSHKDIERSQDLECDVCIIGSGAGGATLAAGLAEEGFDVIMLEAGQHRWRKDFNMDEGEALQNLYQESGLRTTADLSISILQGQCVGGSTTINWTTCFRTPERILKLWQSKYGATELSSELLKPHFEAVEARLNVHPWPKESINPNNRVILDGCEALGWEASTLRRNVKGCANSGYCGMGCPVDGKQGMLVTYIPDALKSGMRLYTNVRAERIEYSMTQAEQVIAQVWNPQTNRFTGKTLRIRAKIIVSSAGAINGPALFLRSGLNNNGLVGTRTFLHPVVGISAQFKEQINGFYGAPQSASSHHFIDRGNDKVGFFIEAAPTHPMLAATALSVFGTDQQLFMKNLAHSSFLIALHVDGILEGDNGGTVSLKSDGRINIDYPISDQLKEAFLASHQALCKLALAAGAEQVSTLHPEPLVLKSSNDLPSLSSKTYGGLEHGIFTAHQMGGLRLGSDPATSVVNPNLQHHQLNNLFVVDGSVFPTALGVNPSLTIYALAHRARATIKNLL